MHGEQQQFNNTNGQYQQETSNYDSISPDLINNANALPLRQQQTNPSYSQLPHHYGSYGTGYSHNAVSGYQNPPSGNYPATQSQKQYQNAYMAHYSQQIYASPNPAANNYQYLYNQTPTTADYYQQQQQQQQQQLQQQQLQQQQLKQQESTPVAIPISSNQSSDRTEPVVATEKPEKDTLKRSRDNDDDEWNPKRARQDEEKQEVEPEEKEPLEPVKVVFRDDNDEPDDNIEIEVTWPEYAVLPKDDDDDGTEINYSRVKIGENEFSVGDHVVLYSEDGSIGESAPKCTIKALFSDGESNVVVCSWFYNVEETIHKGNKRNKYHPREIFVSNHIDENPVEAIAKKVTIKAYSEIETDENGVAKLDEFVAQRDCFFYKKKYNHIQKCFEDL